MFDASEKISLTFIVMNIIEKLQCLPFVKEQKIMLN